MGRDIYSIKDAREYADGVISNKDEIITLSKEEFKSYIYWAFANGMSRQSRNDMFKHVLSKIRNKSKTNKDSDNMKKNPFEDIENEIEGYKYVLELSISIDDPLDSSNADRVCICDTRDEAIEQIKKDLERNIEANKQYGISTEPYNITRLGTIVKWKEDNSDKTWWWSYGIYPVRYITNK